MTILEAIKTVLSKETNGLTCKDITKRILSEKLYSFNAQDPNAIVGHCLRKHCQGLDFPSAHPVKHFYIVSGKRGTAVYNLLNQADQGHEKRSQKLLISSDSDLLPEEKMQIYHKEHIKSLKNQLLDMILNNDPSFFEHLVIKLLLSCVSRSENRSCTGFEPHSRRSWNRTRAAHLTAHMPVKKPQRNY